MELPDTLSAVCAVCYPVQHTIDLLYRQVSCVSYTLHPYSMSWLKLDVYYVCTSNIIAVSSSGLVFAMLSDCCHTWPKSSTSLVSHHRAYLEAGSLLRTRLNSIHKRTCAGSSTRREHTSCDGSLRYNSDCRHYAYKDHIYRSCFPTASVHLCGMRRTSSCIDYRFYDQPKRITCLVRPVLLTTRLFSCSNLRAC